MTTRIRIYLFLLFTVCLCFSCLAAESTGNVGIPYSTQEYSTRPRNQKFVCNVGYTITECRKQTAVVQRTVAHYRGDDLGNWTWILVRAEDWKDLMRRLRLNPESPAFTAVEAHETFLEESLITPKPERAKQLMYAFGISLDQLLDLAVTHELGHAICHGGTEFQADRVATRLREGLPPRCAEK